MFEVAAPICIGLVDGRFSEMAPTETGAKLFILRTMLFNTDMSFEFCSQTHHSLQFPSTFKLIVGNHL